MHGRAHYHDPPAEPPEMEAASDARAAGEALPLDAALALRFGFVTRRDLARVLGGPGGGHDDVAERLAGLGLLTAQQLERIRSMRGFLRQRASDLRTAQDLVRAGRVDPEAVRRALAAQESDWLGGCPVRPLGELLAGAGAIDAAPETALPSIPSPPRDFTPPPPPSEDAEVRAAEAPPAGEDASTDDELDDALVAEEGALRLHVSGDRLTATLERLPGVGPAPSLADVHRLLHRERVVHGLVDDAVIGAWLAKPRPGPLVVARGDPGVPGADARVEYTFDLDPLRAGTEREDGTFDFQDRGELPVVTAGTVLATKIPGREGVPGRTVLGTTVPVYMGRDVPLRTGRNARFSSDRLSVVAVADGHPMVLADGRVSVFPAVVVDGGIGPHTGHVSFPGAVRVNGAVQAGFNVECGRLTAEEIGRSEVRAEGNVLVKGSVIGARIRADGSLHARTVRGATLEVLGDVFVEREVVDSEIRCSGRVRVLRGRIIDSQVIARHGIEAHTIGSERSKPCTLRVGIDPVRQARLDELGEELAAAERDLKREREALQRHEYRRGRAEDERAALEEQAANIRADIDNAAPPPTRERLSARLADIEGRLEALAEELRDHEAKVEAHQAAIAEIEERMAALRTRMDEIRDDMAAEGIRATVRVHGRLQAGTRIIGPNARMEVARDLQHVVIKERNVGTRDQPAWRMTIR